jgi:regulator of RNase E activity RraB
MLNPEEEALERARQRLVALAEGVGGEYDGWEMDVITDQ